MKEDKNDVWHSIVESLSLIVAIISLFYTVLTSKCEPVDERDAVFNGVKASSCIDERRSSEECDHTSDALPLPKGDKLALPPEGAARKSDKWSSRDSFKR